MYYVYEWFIVETGEVIYVGKGCRNRYRAKKKNKFLNRLLETNNCDVRFVAYYNTEAEAFEAERQRIVELKEMGQAVCNKCVYSTGGVGYIWTDERRHEKSINNPMKRPEQRERMSKLNPMKNKEIAERVNAQKRVPVRIGCMEFASVKEAANCLGKSQTTIRTWVNKGVSPNGIKCEEIQKQSARMESDSPHISHQELNHTIIYDGKEFQTTKEVAAYAGVRTTSTIVRWCRKGFSSTGVPCRYKDDTTEYVYQKPNKAHGQKPITIDGVTYSSRVEAAERLNVPYDKIIHIARKQKHDNQKPSQENTDKSTLEGSTTNG